MLDKLSYNVLQPYAVGAFNHCNNLKAQKIMSNEKLSNEALNPPLSKGVVMPCTFSDLEIGDKVQIKHYHLYKDGHWQSPSFIDYKYLGVKNGEHHFQNVNYEHEHFRMKKDFEDNHVFLGKYKS